MREENAKMREENPWRVVLREAKREKNMWLCCLEEEKELLDVLGVEIDLLLFFASFYSN